MVTTTTAAGSGGRSSCVFDGRRTGRRNPPRSRRHRLPHVRLLPHWLSPWLVGAFLASCIPQAPHTLPLVQAVLTGTCMPEQYYPICGCPDTVYWQDDDIAGAKRCQDHFLEDDHDFCTLSIHNCVNECAGRWCPLPTPAPTFHPSPAPSHPTQVPTPTPTQVPSEQPSPAPTHSLAPTPVPSALPSAGPTTDPSSAPTSLPSLVPSFAPSASPTTVPTQPTGLPSWAPTAAPSLSPTLAPSTTTKPPTPTPTRRPTHVPSPVPTTVAPTSANVGGGGDDGLKAASTAFGGGANVNQRLTAVDALGIAAGSIGVLILLALFGGTYIKNQAASRTKNAMASTMEGGGGGGGGGSHLVRIGDDGASVSRRGGATHAKNPLNSRGGDNGRRRSRSSSRSPQRSLSKGGHAGGSSSQRSRSRSRSRSRATSKDSLQMV